MRALIKPKTGFLDLEKASALAAQLQQSDPDWEYRVVDCNNGLGRIDVYDDERELVEKGFLPT